MWQKKKNEKMDRYDFTVHDCTQEQKIALTFLPSFDNANGHLCQELMIFEIQKFCYLGSVTSHFSHVL